MTEPMRIDIAEDTRFREHRGPQGHPERPERLQAVSQALAPFADRLHRITPRPAEPSEILRIHAEGHLSAIEQAVARAPAQLDPDTYVSAESFDVALLAAGSTVELARRVARGDADCALAAVRPPGHHAEATRAMGFCLFNNVAIAARALQAEEGIDKLMVLDWDVHHGNGTQHSFEADPSILYVSTHQHPHYPGTGLFGEVGRGEGIGATLNVPMPAGCGDAEYLGVMQRIVVPAARTFAPEAILVSCGFDAHMDDPLAGMELSASGYLDMTRVVRALANEICGGRLVFVLEGGYAASGLEQGTTAVLQGMLEPVAALPAPPEAPPGSTLRALLDQVAEVHSARYPGTGAV